jgi:hypothetical protein
MSYGKIYRLDVRARPRLLRGRDFTVRAGKNPSARMQLASARTQPSVYVDAFIPSPPLLFLPCPLLCPLPCGRSLLSVRTGCVRKK